MKTILVLTDFSPAALQAAEAALKIAGRLKAEIVLFHSYSLPLISAAKNMQYDYTALDAESLDKLKREKERLLELNPERLIQKPKIGILNSIRPISDNLYELQQAKEIILVVMGERTDKRNSFLFGNHIHVALRNSACPLLIVTARGFEPFGSKGNFACDFDLEDLKGAAFLAHLAAKFSAGLYITHVSAPTILVPDFREQGKLSAFTKGFRLLNLSNAKLKYLVSYDLVAEIGRFDRANGVDLVILTNREHNLFWKLFNRKASKAFISSQHIPILILPDKISASCLSMINRSKKSPNLTEDKDKGQII